MREGRVAAFPFVTESGEPGYWRDVGTLESYWQAHMELLAPHPAIDLYDADWPIRTHIEALPPAKLAEDGRRSNVAGSMLSAGVMIGCASISRSVLSTNVHVGDGSVLDEAVVLPNVRIGANCRLHRVIVDSGARVPDGTVVGWPPAEAVDRLSGPHVTLVTAQSAEPNDIRSVA